MMFNLYDSQLSVKCMVSVGHEVPISLWKNDELHKALKTFLQPFQQEKELAQLLECWNANKQTHNLINENTAV